MIRVTFDNFRNYVNHLPEEVRANDTNELKVSVLSGPFCTIQYIKNVWYRQGDITLENECFNMYRQKIFSFITARFNHCLRIIVASELLVLKRNVTLCLRKSWSIYTVRSRNLEG